MADFHFLTDHPWEDQSRAIPVTFKVRHTDPFRTGTFFPEEGRVVSDMPVQGIVPGQFCVVYDQAHRICAGSGEISPAHEFDNRPHQSDHTI